METKETIWAAIETMAKKKMQADDRLSFEQAVATVIGENPELYNRWVKAKATGKEPYGYRYGYKPGSIRKVAEETIERLADEIQTKEPSLSRPEAITKALETPEGQAAYGEYVRRDGHLTYPEVRKAEFERSFERQRAILQAAYETASSPEEREQLLRTIEGMFGRERVSKSDEDEEPPSDWPDWVRKRRRELLEEERETVNRLWR